MQTKLFQIGLGNILLVVVLILGTWVVMTKDFSGVHKVPLGKSFQNSMRTPFGDCGQRPALSTEFGVFALKGNDYLLGWNYASVGDWFSASQALKNHYIQTGRSYDSYLLGNIYWELDNQSEAIYWWRQGDAGKEFVKLATDCELVGQSEITAKYYDLASQVVSETDLVVYSALLGYYSIQGSNEQFEFALQGYKHSALDLDFDFQLLMKLADAYSNRQIYPEALAVYQKALLLNPDDDLAHYRAGLVAYNLGEYSLAQSHLEYCVNLETACIKFARATLILGHIAYSRQQWDQAFYWYAQSEPQYHSLRYMAQARIQQNRLADAKILIEDAISLFPEDIDNYLLLAQICDLQQNTNCIIEAYQTILALDPTNPIAKEELSKLLTRP